jgi:hypothetical protein
VDFAERAARNEEIFRSVNEQIERGVELHDVHAPIPYHCECGRTACFETVEIRPAEYERVAGERYRFVVVPGHEDTAIELVVETHPGHLVVEKVGEAREQLDRDHPQKRHASTED